MENSLVINNAEFNGTDFYAPGVSAEKGVCSPAMTAIPSGTDKDLTAAFRITGLFSMPLFRVFFSVVRSLVFAVKVIVIFSFSSIYFLLGSFAAFMYLVFYEKLYKTIFCTPGIKKHRSPYYYKWDKHHMEYTYEV